MYTSANAERLQKELQLSLSKRLHLAQLQRLLSPPSLTSTSSLLIPPHPLTSLLRFTYYKHLPISKYFFTHMRFYLKEHKTEGLS